MAIEIEGIVLRQVKTLNNRRMLLLFTEYYGKISAGTSVNEKSKSKSALAMRPFTVSRFEFTEKNGYINIKNAEIVKSYFKIGEDMDKFANASYVLEFTEKLRPEESSLERKSSRLYPLLIEYLDILEERNRSYETLTISFLIKAMDISGVFPQLKKCSKCGKENMPAVFDIKDAGYICEKCNDYKGNNKDNLLLYKINFDIVNVLIFLMENPIDRVKDLALKPDLANMIGEIIREYIAYHLDIRNIKSESLLGIDNIKQTNKEDSKWKSHLKK